MTVERRAFKHLAETFAVATPFWLVALVHMAMRVPGFTMSTPFDLFESIMVWTAAIICIVAVFRFKYDLEYQEPVQA